MPAFSLTLQYAQLQLLAFIKYTNPCLTQTEYLKFIFFVKGLSSHVQVDFVIRGLFIWEFAFSYFKHSSKRPNFQSKCVFLSADSVFAVQNSGTYLQQITRSACNEFLFNNEQFEIFYSIYFTAKMIKTQIIKFFSFIFKIIQKDSILMCDKRPIESIVGCHNSNDFLNAAIREKCQL